MLAIEEHRRPPYSFGQCVGTFAHCAKLALLSCPTAAVGLTRHLRIGVPLPSFALRRKPSRNLYELDRHRNLNAAASRPIALMIGFNLDQSRAMCLEAAPMTEEIKLAHASPYIPSGLIK